MKDCKIIDIDNIRIRGYVCSMEGGQVVCYKDGEDWVVEVFHEVKWTHDFIACERDIPSFYK